MLFKNNFSPLILPLIILYAFVVRIINIDYNSPFLDEAIYVVFGKKILEGQFREVADSISWVGGLPFFYPLLSAIFYQIGGILGSRIFNVFLGTAAVFLIYKFTNQLHLLKEEVPNRITSFIAATFAATTAIPIALSRLAIYDMLSFTIFLMAIVIFQKALQEGNRFRYLSSAIALFFAFLAKYIVAIFFPFLLALPIYLNLKREERAATITILKYFWLPLIFLSMFYLIINFSSLVDFTLGQTLKEMASFSAILENFWKYLWISYLFSLGGVIVLWQKKKGALTILLAVASVLPLIAHLVAREGLSVAQHSFLSLIFILPLVGIFFSTIIQKNPKAGILLAGAAIAFNLFYSASKVRELESFWPNTDKAVWALKAEVTPNDKILAEAGDVVTLAFYNKIKSDQIMGPFVFSFKDKEGLPAYLAAIDDEYFNFVELDGTSFSLDSILAIEKALSEKYFLFFDDGEVRIWQLKR